MFLGSYRFDGDPADLMPGYRRVMAATPADNIHFHVCTSDAGGITVIDACPTQQIFEEFSTDPGLLGLFASCGLPTPTVAHFGQVEHTQVDHEQDEPPGAPLFLQHLASWFTMQALAAGHRVGLLAALASGPGSAAELGERAHVDAHTALTWAAALTAAGYATHDDGTFTMRPEVVPDLTGTGGFIDTLAILDIVNAIGAVVPGVIDSIATGAALPAGHFSGAFADAVGCVNGPMYQNYLAADWFAGDTELVALLERGATVVDLGCGNGTATAVMASAYPASTFCGVDRDAHVIARAGSSRSLPNLSFSTEWPQSCDVVTIFDAFHHFTDPDTVLRQIRSVVVGGGTLVIVEPSYSGDLDADTSDPTAAIGLGAELFYCDREGRNPGAAPAVSAHDGGAMLRAIVREAGFSDLRDHEGTGDYRLLFAR